jgi:IS5 family transposase
MARAHPVAQVVKEFTREEAFDIAMGTRPRLRLLRKPTLDAIPRLKVDAEMTSANVHDSPLGEALIQGDEQGFFADRAYDSQALRETLEARGLVDGIAWKVKHARYPLETWQKLHNAWAGSVRPAVERAFATIKRWYGWAASVIWGLPATPAIFSSSRWQ